MTRTRLGLCCSLSLLAAAAGAHAQNVQITGLLDMSAGSFQNAGTVRQTRADSGNMSTSFIGFRGTEDLSGGLKAKFAIEHYLRLDSGSVGRVNGGAFWARNSYVGLSGAFGTTTLGRHTTPLFVSTLLFNAFGDSFGFSPSIRQLFTPNTAVMPAFLGDTAWNNSLAYSSGETDGLSLNVIGNLGEGATGASGKNLGGNALYFNGPLAATVAWQRVRNGMVGAPAGATGQTTWQLGASYELAFAKLYGQYSEVRTTAMVNDKSHLWSFGAAIPLGPGRVLAQYGIARGRIAINNPTNKTLTLGYDYNLSKNSDAYAVYMNDKATGLTNGNTLAGGLRLRF
jgi:predicted porin